MSSRPDLSYVVTKLSQHLSAPRKYDWIMLKHVFKYIKGTLDYKLTYKKSDKNLNIISFCDVDCCSSIEDRRSLTGCFLLSESGPAVTWKCRKQQTVALSTCEAEYMALSETTQESIYLLKLLRDIDIDNVYKPVI